jgi:hypothetical protein
MTHLSVRAARAAARALAAVLLAACESSGDTNKPRPVGYFQVSANGDVSATEAHPAATFVRALGLTVGNTANPGDTCEVLAFSDTPGTPETVPGVSAGEALSMVLSGTTTTLMPHEQAFGRIYLPAEESVAFTPGDSAKLTIPGAADGFPATSFSVKTAERIIWDGSIPVVADGTAGTITVRWNAGDVNSTMILSMRYEIPTSSSVQQVLCLMKDDGVFTIPSNRLAGWLATTTTERRVLATRLRNSGVALDGGALLYGSASFRMSVPVAGSAALVQ